MAATAQPARVRAAAALFAMEHVTDILAICQLGITVCSLLILNVSEPAIAYLFGIPLEALGLDPAFAGVLAAPIYQVSPLMGSNMIIVVFAVVVVGGMGSIMGAIITGYVLGIAEGLTKVFYPEASNIVIFVIMAIVLLIRPAGLFGRDA